MSAAALPNNKDNIHSYPAEILKPFSALLGFSELQAEDLIVQMANDNYRPDGTYFIEAAQSLPVIDLDLKSNILPITSGSYGAVSRITKETRSSHVVKEIKIPFNFRYGQLNTNAQKNLVKETNTKLRDIFVEIFIQFILGSDVNYGKNIVKVHKVYRSLNYKSIIIEMDAIDTDIFAYFANECTRHMPIENGIIVTVLAIMAKLLNNLYSRYKFVHRDCKMNNVGFKLYDATHEANLVLFDFGASCMEYMGKKYSALAFYSSIEQPCNPNSDLGLFTYSMYTEIGKCLKPSMKGFLEGLLKKDDFLNLMENIELNLKLRHKIHAAYNLTGTLYYGTYNQFDPINYINSLEEFMVEQTRIGAAVNLRFSQEPAAVAAAADAAKPNGPYANVLSLTPQQPPAKRPRH